MNDKDSGVLLTICIGVGLTLLFFILFCIARVYNKTFYEGRTFFCRDSTHPPHELPPTFFSWLSPFFRNFSIRSMLYTHGIDAYVYLRFLRAILITVLFIGVLGWVILFPINYSGTNKNLDPNDAMHVSGIASVSIANIKERSHLLWAHYAFTLVVTMVVLAMLAWEGKEYFDARLYYKRQIIPSNYNVIITEIPKDYNTCEKIMQHLNAFAPIRSQIVQVTMCFNDSEINHRFKMRKKAIQKLTDAQSDLEAFDRRPMTRDALFGHKVDAIDYWTNRIKIHNMILKQLLMVADRRPAGASFVTFSTRNAAQMFGHSLIGKGFPAEWHVHPAPEPADVNWNQLHVGLTLYSLRMVVTYTCVFLLIAFWAVPVVFLSGISNLETLSKVKGLNFLVDLVKKSALLTDFLQSVLPNLALIIFNALLPTIVRAIAKIEAFRAKSQIDRSALAKQFLFMLINVLLIYTIGNSIFSFLQEIIDQPGLIVSLLANSLPIQATQFTNYIIIACALYHPMELLRPFGILISILKKKKQKLLNRIHNRESKSLTEQELMEIDKPKKFPYSRLWTMDLLVFAISITYSTMNPFILIFSVLYFTVALISSFYNIKYSHVPKYEGGGILWPTAFRRVLVALLVYQLTMIGVLNLKRVPATTSLFGAVIVTLVFWFFCEKLFLKKASRGVLEYESGVGVPLPQEFRNAYVQPCFRSEIAKEEFGGDEGDQDRLDKHHAISADSITLSDNNFLKEKVICPNPAPVRSDSANNNIL